MGLGSSINVNVNVTDTILRQGHNYRVMQLHCISLHYLVRRRCNYDIFNVNIHNFNLAFISSFVTFFRGFFPWFFLRGFFSLAFSPGFITNRWSLIEKLVHTYIVEMSITKQTYIILFRVLASTHCLF